MNKDEVPKSYDCNECEYKSLSKRVLKTHKRLKHSRKETQVKPTHDGNCYMCEFCNYSSFNVRTYENHKRTKHGSKCARNDIVKYPIPPKPVLSLKNHEIKTWFPSFFSKLSFELKRNRQNGLSNPVWLKDIEDVIDLKALMLKLSSSWEAIDRTFFWKLKLISAIVLERKGFDYTNFGIKVTKQYERYPIKDLKLMSDVKNPATFESMFL